MIQDDQGTVTIELVLVIPMVLFFALLLVQVMLLMAANHFVRYAAYTAVRSAIVQIPADDTASGGLAANQIVTDTADAKFASIRRAAVFALWPISGRLRHGGTENREFSSALQTYYGAFGRKAPNWVARLADDKLQYAHANTRLHLMRADVPHAGDVRFTDMASGRRHRFGTKEPVTARVDHDFSLTVPIIAGIFAQGHLDASHGGTWYTRITARCTLNNEGIPDTMPPPPSLPRTP